MKRDQSLFYFECLFDYSLHGYRVEDIRILFLSKVIQPSPTLHFRTVNKPTSGNVFNLPVPLREWLLYVPGHPASGRLVSPRTPACLALSSSSCGTDTSEIIWKASPAEPDSLLSGIRAASGYAG